MEVEAASGYVPNSSICRQCSAQGLLPFLRLQEQQSFSKHEQCEGVWLPRMGFWLACGL